MVEVNFVDSFYMWVKMNPFDSFSRNPFKPYRISLLIRSYVSNTKSNQICDQLVGLIYRNN